MTIFQKTIGLIINLVSFISPKLSARIAIFLFTKPFKGKITLEQSDFLETAFKEEFTYKKFPIMSYRWLGNKETVLLVHGWESNSARWKNLILELKKQDFNIIALDAPAHGNSGGNRFNALLYAEFINVISQRFKPTVIIGHSVGGMASIFSQSKYQNTSVKKIILLGAPSEFKNILERYTNMLGYNQRTITQINTTIIERYGASPEDFSTAKQLKNITSKGLIIHDKEDDIIPYEDAILIKKHFKSSTLITTNGLGHSLRDTSINKHICQFLEN
ncbi:alpha/beta hydrolase [Mangrovimonas spongiae]|uniref:Alpha/beta hydrolase n=1 Tax=Mangrovimonas spongiae TaxID=2494697 RepID=A0A428K2K3_9FLAO|nr:alpha/beta hydrolase [Mangrovimonas spongiae]RSK40615.1 alpha/beta hydrolase [Mangrovimonas spongiae]